MICWLHNGIYNRCCLCEWSHAPLVILVREIVLITIDHHWVYYAAVHWDRALWPTSCRCGRGNLRRNDSEPNWIKRQNGNTWPFVPFDPLSPNSILNLHSKVKLNCMRRPPKKKTRNKYIFKSNKVGWKGCYNWFWDIAECYQDNYERCCLTICSCLAHLQWLHCHCQCTHLTSVLETYIPFQFSVIHECFDTASLEPKASWDRLQLPTTLNRMKSIENGCMGWKH